MPTIDIDRDAAHEAAQHELAKPIYPKPSLTDRLLDWISELFYRLMDATAGVPGGWFTLGVVGILLAIARISGETAPLLFTSLGNLNWSLSLTKPMASLPVTIYQYAGSAFQDSTTYA